MKRRSKKRTSPALRDEDGHHRGPEVGYSVGFGRPPVEKRFKPGTSGNPNGRPKGKRNLALNIRDVYMGEVVIREGEKTYRTTRLEALLRKQLERAFKGDERATLAVCKIADRLGLFMVHDKQPQYDREKFQTLLTTLSDDEFDVVERVFSTLTEVSSGAEVVFAHHLKSASSR